MRRQVPGLAVLVAIGLAVLLLVSRCGAAEVPTGPGTDIATPSATPTPAATTAGISVRDLGATGDGVTDDSAAILRTRDAAGPGGTVVFPAGTYRFTQSLSMNVAAQHWVLQSGATLAADAQIFMDARAVQLAGPGAIDERGGVRMGVEIRYSAASLTDGDVIDGVEFKNLGTSTNAAFIFVGGSYAQVRNSYLHDGGADGAILNTDGGNGLQGVEFRGNRFENILYDGIHSKGTNGDWNNGTWIPLAQRNVGHKFIGNVLRNTAQVQDSFSLEIQDGHVNAEIRDNWADHTYSIVGQLGAQVTGNTFVGTGSSGWAMEYGNARKGLVDHNSFTTCDTGIAMTGNTDQLNADNTFSYNTFSGCPTHIAVAWVGGGNVYISN